MESSTIVGLGAGGHGRVIADILFRLNDFTLAGWLDNSPKLKGQSVSGAPVLGDDSHLSLLVEQGINHAFIGIGSIGDPTARRKVTQSAMHVGINLPVIADLTACISKTSTVADGTCIFPHAVVNPGTHIGLCSIINTQATVEHDCVIGDFCHLAPGSIIGGGCNIGTNTHIGIGAIVKEGITIGANSLIGAGAVVVSDIPANTTAVGMPAKATS